MIEVVIKLSDKYKDSLLEGSLTNDQILEVYRAARRGIILPKGHGNLKDELDLDLTAPSLGTDEYINDLMAKHNIDYVNGDDEDKVKAFAMDLIHGCMNVIKTAPTIIEVDRTESEDEG